MWPWASSWAQVTYMSLRLSYVYSVHTRGLRISRPGGKGLALSLFRKDWVLDRAELTAWDPLKASSYIPFPQLPLPHPPGPRPRPWDWSCCTQAFHCQQLRNSPLLGPRKYHNFHFTKIPGWQLFGLFIFLQISIFLPPSSQLVKKGSISLLNCPT